MLNVNFKSFKLLYAIFHLKGGRLIFCSPILIWVGANWPAGLQLHLSAGWGCSPSTEQWECLPLPLGISHILADRVPWICTCKIEGLSMSSQQWPGVGPCGLGTGVWIHHNCRCRLLAPPLPPLRTVSFLPSPTLKSLCADQTWTALGRLQPSSAAAYIGPVPLAQAGKCLTAHLWLPGAMQAANAIMGLCPEA